MLTVPTAMGMCPGWKLEGKKKAVGLISKNWKAKSPSHVSGSKKFLALFRIRICMLGLVSGHLLICFTVSDGFQQPVSKGFVILKKPQQKRVKQLDRCIVQRDVVNAFISLWHFLVQLLKASWQCS